MVGQLIFFKTSAAICWPSVRFLSLLISFSSVVPSVTNSNSPLKLLSRTVRATNFSTVAGSSSSNRWLPVDVLCLNIFGH